MNKAKNAKKPAANKAAGKNKSVNAKPAKKPGKPAKPAKPVKSAKPAKPAAKKGENVGKVYRGVTKYIDTEPKAERNYVVVDDDGRRVAVSKLKSIKKFDENGRNADKALVEIKDVFPEGKERFKLGSHDLNRTLIHTGQVLRPKKKR